LTRNCAFSILPRFLWQVIVLFPSFRVFFDKKLCCPCNWHYGCFASTFIIKN
jgi:hypothetical protein